MKSWKARFRRRVGANNDNDISVEGRGGAVELV